MSIECISFVWQTSQYRGSTLVMMLALADYANEAGECWPGIAALADKARMTDRNAQLLLGKLAADGVISIRLQKGPETRTGRTNLYTILGFKGWLQGVKKLSSSGRGVKSGVARGENSGMEGVKTVSPDPSLESVNDPSYGTASAVPPKKRRSKNDPGPKQTPELKDSIARVCFGTETAWKTGQAASLAKALREVLALEPGVTPARFSEFTGWWLANDWRGRRGQFPRPHEVASGWMDFTRGGQREQQPVDDSTFRAPKLYRPGGQ